MPLWCSGCAERRLGPVCKKWCREKYGDLGAERIPRMVGWIVFGETADNQGTPRYEWMKEREN